MAINYQEVGWNNSMFVNPSNMNQMDAGIKAACDGIDKLEEEVVNVSSKIDENVADLQNQIDTANSNLGYIDITITPKSGISLLSSSFIHKRKFDSSYHYNIRVSSGVSSVANSQVAIATLSESISNPRTFDCVIMNSGGVLKGIGNIFWFLNTLYLISNVDVSSTDQIYSAN